jgi:hypothetical protein
LIYILVKGILKYKPIFFWSLSFWEKLVGRNFSQKPLKKPKWSPLNSLFRIFRDTSPHKYKQA